MNTLAVPRLDALGIALAIISLSAWSMLALGRPDWIPLAFCSRGLLAVAPLSASFRLALLLTPPTRLALAWTLMVAAMMAPLLSTPLRHVRDQCTRRRCAWPMLLFSAGYMGVWLIAGAALQPMALALHYAVPSPLVSLGVAVLIALVWQITPAKQWCLNCCHRQPTLATFGAAVDREVFLFGLTSGAACAGACWALMLLPLFFGAGHCLAMIAVTVFVVTERQKSPTRVVWRFSRASGNNSVGQNYKGNSRARAQS